MLRLFVGIGFPPELKLQLSLLCSGIPNARWVDPGNLHLTQLRARRFSLSLAGTGVFGGDRPHNLWVGVERSSGLLALHDKIEQALVRTGLPPEPRKFAPHVTLARLNRAPIDKIAEFLAAHAGFRAGPLPVAAFSLIASFPTKAGSVYEDQADYPLRD